MSARLQADRAPTWLTQGVPLEHDEPVGVGHQEVKTKVEARPPPAILLTTTQLNAMDNRI